MNENAAHFSTQLLLPPPPATLYIPKSCIHPRISLYFIHGRGNIGKQKGLCRERKRYTHRPRCNRFLVYLYIVLQTLHVNNYRQLEEYFIIFTSIDSSIALTIGLICANASCPFKPVIPISGDLSKIRIPEVLISIAIHNISIVVAYCTIRQCTLGGLLQYGHRDLTRIISISTPSPLVLQYCEGNIFRTVHIFGHFAQLNYSRL